MHGIVCSTGHSLGGSLASLAAFDIARELQPGRVEVYSFGAPRMGCWLLEQCVRAHVFLTALLMALWLIMLMFTMQEQAVHLELEPDGTSQHEHRERCCKSV
jgi:Lipase (class 3)